MAWTRVRIIFIHIVLVETKKPSQMSDEPQLGSPQQVTKCLRQQGLNPEFVLNFGFCGLPGPISSNASAYTGKSAFLRPPPILSNILWIYGPNTGMLPAKEPTVAKKSPKRTKIP